MASSGNHETSTNAMSPSPWLTDDQKMVLESKSDALDNGGWNHGGERRRPGGEEEGSLLQEGGGEEGSLHGILLAAEDGDGENGVVNGGRRHGGKRRWPSSEEEESHLQEGVGESGSHDGAEEGILQQGSSGGLLAAAEGGEGGSGGLTWSVATCIGRRNYMEDVVTILPDFMSIPCAKFGGCLSPELHAEKHSQVYYFAVFDGHGGSQVSNYCAASLHNFVVEEWERENNDVNGSSQKWEHVLSRAFTRADDALEDGIVAPRTVGSTALVVIVSACQIIVSNCGDCRAVLCRGNAILSLTRDHKPNRSDEVERIKNRGGRIIFFQGERVEGMLALTRSIGDHYLKQWVTSEPELTFIPRCAEDEFLILASDGLWDKLSTIDVGKLVRKVIKKKRKQAIVNGDFSLLTRSVTSTLLRAARKRGSGDNISVIAVDLASQFHQSCQ